MTKAFTSRTVAISQTKATPQSRGKRLKSSPTHSRARMDGGGHPPKPANRGLRGAHPGVIIIADFKRSQARLPLICRGRRLGFR
jgi:hypothetical protein